MEIFEASKTFPKEETHSLTDQVRRSSRSVPMKAEFTLLVMSGSSP